MSSINSYQIHKRVTDSLTDEGLKLLKDKITQLFNNKHKHNDLKKGFSQKQIFNKGKAEDPHNKYATFIGHGSEYFIESLQKANLSSEDLKKDFLTSHVENIEDLLESSNPIEHVIAESIHQNKIKNDYHRKNRVLEKNMFDMSYLFSAGGPVSLIREDLPFFKKIINHFKDEVFSYVVDMASRDDFCKKLHEHENLRSKHTFACNIQGGAFDFYDFKEEKIVDLKFQQTPFAISGVGQTLLYVYLMNREYDGIGVNGIKIINTSLGIEFSASLTDLFGQDGKKEFLKICKLEIPDKEKESFKNKLQHCYIEYQDFGVVSDKNMGYFFYQDDQKKLDMIKSFILDLFSKIKSERDLSSAKQLGELGIDWQDDCGQ